MTNPTLPHNDDSGQISTAELEIGYLEAQLCRLIEEYNNEIADRLFSGSGDRPAAA
jgi:hypothetical protein